MDDIEKLIQKGERSLKAAQRLYRDGDFDFSVSRAYYAMFYLTEAVLVHKGLSFSKHSAVISAFNQHFIKTGIFPKEFHQWLTSAFEKRQIGDYVYSAEITEYEAKQMLSQAEEFLNSLKKIFKEESKKEKK